MKYAAVLEWTVLKMVYVQMVLNTIGTSQHVLAVLKRSKYMKRTIEIRAAEGGEDSKLFVKDLAQAYIKFAHSKG